MVSCWRDKPEQRPNFSQLREELERVMSHGETYVSFEIDEDSEYFQAPSFNSLSHEQKKYEINADEMPVTPVTAESVN